MCYSLTGKKGVHVHEHNDFKTNIELFGTELCFTVGVKIVIYNIVLLILIITAFLLNNEQWYISFPAINISRPDSKESCPVNPTRLCKVLCTHLHHVNCINLNYTLSSI